MKQLLEQYAAAVIAGILALLLLLIIRQNIYGQGMGISQVLGLIVQNSVCEKSIIENHALEDYVKDTALMMEIKQVYVIANQDTEGKTCFCVKNISGEFLPVYWKRVWNSQWQAEYVTISPDGSCIRFSKPGIYWVEVFSVDKNEIAHSWVAKVLVNER